MPRIFDNIEKELLPALQETIKLSQSKQQADVQGCANAVGEGCAGTARATIDRLLVQVGSDAYDPGWVNLFSLCGITIRDRTAVWPLSIESDPVGFFVYPPSFVHFMRGLAKTTKASQCGS